MTTGLREMYGSGPGNDERLQKVLMAVQQLNAVINNQPNPETIVARALKIVAEAMGVEKALILQHDPATSSLVPLLPAYGVTPNELQKLSQLRVGLNDYDYPSSVVRSFSTKRLIVSNTIDEMHKQGHYLIFKVQNEIVAPISAEGRMQAVCVLINKTTNWFDREDEMYTSVLVGTLTTLLKNISLNTRLEAEQRKHETVLDAAVDGLIEVDTQLRIVGFSKGAEQMTGWQRSDAMGKRCQDVLLPHSPNNDLLCANCPMKQAFRSRNLITVNETLINSREGEERWVSTSYNSITNERDEITSGVIAIKDIYRLKALSDDLRQQIEQQSSLLGVINALSGVSTLEEIYRRSLEEVANAINFELGTIHAVEMVDQPGAHKVLKLMAIYEQEGLDIENEDDDLDSVFDPIAILGEEIGTADTLPDREKLAELGGQIMNYLQADRPSRHLAHYHPIDYDACDALRQNESYMALTLPGKPVCNVLSDFPGIRSHLCVQIKTAERIYGVLHLASRQQYAFGGSDFTLAHNICKQIAIAAERAHLFDKVQQLARTDPLTGLYNKWEFWGRLRNELDRSSRAKSSLSLMMIDLDNLKKYNDTYGHSHGDVLLTRLAQLVKNNCRSIDIAFRYGGDELCVIMPDTPPEAARQAAERIRLQTHDLRLQSPGDDIIIGGGGEQVTLSIGIAGFPQHGKNAGQLFEMADSAAYRAKETGKDRVCVFDPVVDNNRMTSRGNREQAEYYTLASGEDVQTVLPGTSGQDLRLPPLIETEYDSDAVDYQEESYTLDDLAAELGIQLDD